MMFRYLLLCSILFSFNDISIAKKVDILVGIQKGWIDAKVVGKGGYSEQSVLLKIENLRNRKMEIFIPAGLVFISTDSTEQDLIVVQERLLVIGKKSKRNLSLRAMCIQASNNSPSKGSAFQIGTVAKNELLKLASYLNISKLYKKQGQFAIWAVTDKKRVENIPNPKLADFTAQLLGVDPPKYHIVHDNHSQEGQRAFVASPSIIKGVFKYELMVDEAVSFSLYDENGDEKLVVFENESRKKGKHRFKFTFKIKGFPSGKYYARLLGTSGQIQELMVEF